MFRGSPSVCVLPTAPSSQENSTSIYGEGTAPEESVVGIENIKEKLAARSSRGYIVSLEHGTVDAQQSSDGGVLLMVTGTITRKGSDQPSQVRSLRPPGQARGGLPPFFLY